MLCHSRHASWRGTRLYNSSTSGSETPLDLAMFKGKFGDRSDFKEVVKLLETGKLGGGEGTYMDYDV